MIHKDNNDHPLEVGDIIEYINWHRDGPSSKYNIIIGFEFIKYSFDEYWQIKMIGIDPYVPDDGIICNGVRFISKGRKLFKLLV